MGEIRSALDIALEKTEGIKGGRQAIENEKAKKQGKKAAALFLNGGSAKDLADEAGKVSALDKESFIKGAMQIFCAAVKLPDDEEGASTPRKWGEGLKLLLPKAELDALFRQAELIFRQYLEERDTLRAALENQFMPKLKAKEEELSRRYGQRISLSLSQDVEYNAALSKSLKGLQSQYEAVADEIRARITEAAGIQEDD